MGIKSIQKWPLWKKLVVSASIVAIVLGVSLGVGLGVGLKHGDSETPSATPQSNSTAPGTEMWQPAPNTTWQIVLSGVVAAPSESVALTPAVSVYDIDLFNHNASTIKALQQHGARVICYFSAGSYENFRPDKDDFPAADLGSVMDGWPDERWVNISSPKIRLIMAKRIQLAYEKGCDAIDPDNVDGYQNENGLGLTSYDSVAFVFFLSSIAANLNLPVGLKNAGDIIPQVLSFVAFSVNEQCIQYGECDTFSAFIDAGKPVFNIEYPDSAPNVSEATRAEICSGTGNAAHTEGFSTVIKTMDLDGWVEYCNGQSFSTVVEGKSEE